MATVYTWSRPRTEYATARVDRGDIDSTVNTTGNLNAVVTVQVGSQVSGNIKALYADFNTKVKKGQLVAQIDPVPFQAAVDQSKATLNTAKAAVLTAQATLAKSQSDLASALATIASQKANVVKAQSAVDLTKVEADRRLILVQQDATSREDYDTAKANYDQALASIDAAKADLNAAEASAESARKSVEVAQAQLQQAEATVDQDQAALAQAQFNLNNTRIVAPVDGTVESRNMDVGQTVHHLQSNEDDDFTIRNMEEVFRAQENSARIMSILLAAIASVSLIVGGIGIMKYHAVSVTERTREIGLRQAVGAKTNGHSGSVSGRGDDIVAGRWRRRSRCRSDRERSHLLLRGLAHHD
ncbi:MAG TPA: biotin/lipoyl-binding protein [Bryobacteraceae bacterium]